MTLSSTRFIAIVLLGSALAGCSRSETAPGTAQQPAAVAAPEAAEPPTAEELVRRVGEFYKSKQTMQVDGQASVKTQIAGMQNAVSSSRTVAFQRPNLLAIRSQGEMGEVDIISDGSRLVTFMPALKSYTEAVAPESSDELLTNPGLAMASSGGLFVLSLISGDPQAKIMEGVESSQYVGQEQLDGTDAHHLRFKQEQMDWEMWVDAGDEPLVRQVTVDMSRSMGGMLQQLGQDASASVSVVLTEEFRSWKFDQPLDAATFTFTPPADATKRDNLMEGMPGLPAQEEQEESSPLLNKPAPPLELTLLDGSVTKLADHVGKDVVMLDFWATWCPPCRAEMPVLAEIAQAYAERGVVLYAVNQGEDAETIKGFLDQTKLEVTVALDINGEAGMAYEVEGLPTLVLIDKQGLVQAVHVGYAPGLKETLTQELDTLLAGKSLVEDQ